MEFDYYSVQGAKQINPVMGNRTMPLYERGDLNIALVEMVMQTGMSAGEKVGLIQLPRQAIVLPHLCDVVRQALASTLTFNIGTPATAQAYSGALNIASAGTTAFGNGGSANLNPIVTDEDSRWVVGTFATLATPTVGNKALFRIVFAINT